MVRVWGLNRSWQIVTGPIADTGILEAGHTDAGGEKWRVKQEVECQPVSGSLLTHASCRSFVAALSSHSCITPGGRATWLLVAVTFVNWHFGWNSIDENSNFKNAKKNLPCIVMWSSITHVMHICHTHVTQCPCSDSHAVTAMQWQPCNDSHAVTAMICGFQKISKPNCVCTCMHRWRPTGTVNHA